MARLGDLLQQSVKKSSGLDAEWLMKFASVLKLDLNDAEKVYKAHGNNYIYAKGGFAMPDSERMRRKMVANFRVCVVVDSRGNAMVIDKRDIHELNEIKSAKRKHRQERAERKRKSELAVCREQNRLSKLFKSCQENPSPKRAGKGNGQGDIGRYVNFRGVRMEAAERKCVTKFAIIIINY